MKYHAAHARWIFNRQGEIVCLFGFATGRVDYEPRAKWLYSFRLFLGPVKFEVLWTSKQSETPIGLPEYMIQESLARLERKAGK